MRSREWTPCFATGPAGSHPFDVKMFVCFLWRRETPRPLPARSGEPGHLNTTSNVSGKCLRLRRLKTRREERTDPGRVKGTHDPLDIPHRRGRTTKHMHVHLNKPALVHVQTPKSPERFTTPMLEADRAVGPALRTPTPSRLSANPPRQPERIVDVPCVLQFGYKNHCVARLAHEAGRVMCRELETNPPASAFRLCSTLELNTLTPWSPPET